MKLRHVTDFLRSASRCCGHKNLFAYGDKLFIRGGFFAGQRGPAKDVRLDSNGGYLYLIQINKHEAQWIFECHLVPDYLA